MNIVISLNKDYGITSHDAVTDVKKLFKVRKAGHAGTLDPIATGLLLVCTNEATKIAPFLSGLDKEYIVTKTRRKHRHIRLGGQGDQTI